MENGGFHWHLMPSELKPNFKRKLNAKDGPNKLGKVVNVEEAFKALEQKEKTRKPGSTAKEEDNESDKVSGPIEIVIENAQFEVQF